MVLRRSTTDCTWLSAFNKVARSIVAFIFRPEIRWDKAYSAGESPG
jgi:hypothetical protein